MYISRCHGCAGGAQDIANFRENIEEGFLPLPTDVTFEGVVKVRGGLPLLWMICDAASPRSWAIWTFS